MFNQALQYCVVLAAASESWFKANGKPSPVRALRLLIDVRDGVSIAPSVLQREADLVAELPPDLDDDGSSLASVVLSCCAAISSLLRYAATGEDQWLNGPRTVFLDSIDLAAYLHQGETGHLDNDSLLNLPEVSESLTRTAGTITQDTLLGLLEDKPAWASWLVD